MPPTPSEPAEDEPPSALHYAEQALVGALLLQPDQLLSVPGLLPEHFANSLHSAVFAAMRRLTPPAPDVHRARPIWPQAVQAAAATRAPGLDATYLNTLMAVCPQPDHAAAYAQMVRAEHLRRSLREHAMRLTQLCDDPTLPDPAMIVANQANALAVFLERAAPMWPHISGPMPKQAAPDADPPTPDALDDERLLLATAIAYPDTLVAWLHPEDLVLPLHQVIYRCVTAMAHRGDPIDPITVLWQAHQHAVFSGSDPAEVLDFLRRPVGSVEHWAERIHTRAVVAAARTAGRQITDLTHDSTHAPHHLLHAARRALAPLARIRARRHTPPPTAAPTAPRRPPALTTARVDRQRGRPPPAERAAASPAYPNRGPRPANPPGTSPPIPL
ncbi:DnaB-like helicase N-terminal domain-containing protein [Actinacidiphila sp. bgisy144]|uniref:DnaB-like helicase N-terminal domain-containing protein n=1 Tax=Actinacidiphila sp. bgisy144 TaxID=3413791 RepID=UPI003EB8AD6D